MEKINVRFSDDVMPRVTAIAESLGETPSHVARDAMDLGIELLLGTVLVEPVHEGDSQDQLDLLK